MKTDLKIMNENLLRGISLILDYYSTNSFRQIIENEDLSQIKKHEESLK